MFFFFFFFCQRSLRLWSLAVAHLRWVRKKIAPISYRRKRSAIDATAKRRERMCDKMARFSEEEGEDLVVSPPPVDFLVTARAAVVQGIRGNLNDGVGRRCGSLLDRLAYVGGLSLENFLAVEKASDFLALPNETFSSGFYKVGTNATVKQLKHEGLKKIIDPRLSDEFVKEKLDRIE
ncbi:hypothetical protein EZV62_016523 [Acer yangbiense]|uniref:Uncharacterized protein n=1 Tax=Acer yangbiense TaxID=1000413 RepID=A0A5C7HPE0_9ROSI|nr:hypothetical protein EZV62_016523 [Acer yangbiense]